MICPYSYYCYNFRITNPNNPVTVTTKETKYNDEKIQEDLRIPTAQGSISPKVLNVINSNIQNDIMEFKSQMESEAQEHAEQQKKAKKKVTPYYISNIYSVTYNKNNIICISVIYNQLIDGKSYYIRTTYNYDITNGKSLAVGDLFKPGANYKTLINQEIRNEIISHPKNYFPNALQTFKGISDDQPFFIDGTDLVLFFAFNEIAPVASEIPTVRIPLSRFRNSINPSLLRSSEQF